MKQELRDRLYERYPNSFRTQAPLDCGDGWFSLIDKYSARLEKVIAGFAEPFREGSYISYAKEKYGELSVFMHGGTEDTESIITELEAHSSSICEVCGARGSLRTERSWILTLCDTHNKED